MRSESNTNDEILTRSRQKFILDRASSLVASYCWRENWVSQAESIYSLLQKFAFLNALGARQIGAEVLSEPLRSVIQVKQVSVELTNVASFDWSRLGHLFRIDTAALANAFLAHPHVDQSTVSRQLRYCPRCLQGGFHAAIFQLQFVLECPIHDLPLLAACARCGKDIAYTFNSANFRHPYHCPHCRQPLATGSEGTRLGPSMIMGAADRILLGRVAESTIRKATLIAPVANQYRELSFFMQGVDVRPDRYKDEYWRAFARFSDEVISLIDGRLSVEQHITEASYEQPAKPSRTPNGDAWMRWDQSLWSIVPIYKAIRRRLWRRLMVGHRRCVVGTARAIWWRILGESTGPLCTDAFAFLLWRMSWEGIGTPQALLAEPRHVPYGIVTWLSDTAPICPEDWTRIAKGWLVSRVFALHCLESYLDCISYAQMCEMSKNYYWVSQRSYGVRQPKQWSYSGGTREEHTIRFFQEDSAEPLLRRARGAVPVKQHWRWNQAQILSVKR